MKLADWAKKQGIAYLTAYRWFKDGKLPVEAYQSESGTIIVKDDNLEQIMVSSNSDQSSEVMSVFIKKTVEFSKNDSTIEEFAAYILSNFSLKFNNGQESPKYSKNKPKAEDIQRHFQQFINKKEKPKTNVFIETSEEETIDDLVAKADTLSAQELMEKIQEIGENGESSPAAPSVPELNDLLKALAPTALTNVPTPKVYGEVSSTEGLVSRTVDFNSTPQQINYTSSTDQTFGETLPLSGINTVSVMGLSDWSNVSVSNFTPSPVTATAGFVPMDGVSYSVINNASTTTLGSLFPVASSFKPTQKELESANRLASTEPPAPRKRGRKPSKNKAEK